MQQESAQREAACAVANLSILEQNHASILASGVAAALIDLAVKDPSSQEAESAAAAIRNLTAHNVAEAAHTLCLNGVTSPLLALFDQGSTKSREHAAAAVTSPPARLTSLLDNESIW